MRFDRLWVVARKDLAEVRTSRYVMMSLVAMPLVFAIVIPIVTFVPLSMIPRENTPLPIRLELTTTRAFENLTDQVVVNATVEASRVTNGTVAGSFIGNTTLVRAYVVDSVLWNATLRDCVVRRSNLYNTSRDESTALIESVVVGEETPYRIVMNAMFSTFQLFFILIPVMVPTVMASYTIVGEKTNRSLEPLLASPLTDTELLAGKSLAIFLPSMAATWGAFAIFVGIVFSMLGGDAPYATWFVTLFIVGPLVCVLSIAANVLISSRVSDVRASQQVGSLVVLPLIVFFLAGTAGVFALDPVSVLLFALLLGAADAGIFLLAVRVFDREEILVRWK